MGFYIESADRPLQSRPPAEDIPTGTLVAEDGNDQAKLATFADSHFEGVAERPLTGAQIAEYDNVDDADWDTYEAAENERVNFGGGADRDVVKIRTAEDNGTDPAPSLSDGDVVGIADVGTAEFDGRIVQEGYTDNGGTAYGRSSTGDFLAVGTVYKDEASAFDDPTRVMIRRDL